MACLARVAVLQGDPGTGLKAYEEFFRLWKDADVELPDLIQAKREYEKLKSGRTAALVTDATSKFVHLRYDVWSMDKTAS